MSVISWGKGTHISAYVNITKKKYLQFKNLFEFQLFAYVVAVYENLPIFF